MGQLISVVCIYTEVLHLHHSSASSVDKSLVSHILSLPLRSSSIGNVSKHVQSDRWIYGDTCMKVSFFALLVIKRLNEKDNIVILSCPASMILHCGPWTWAAALGRARLHVAGL